MEREPGETLIRPIGTLLTTDGQGNLINPSSMDRVQASWRPLVDACVDEYRTRCGDRLHSVWLRGSVATGQAIDGLADLDTFALVHGSGAELPWAEEVHERLTREYPFCTGVEIWAVPVDLVVSGAKEKLQVLVKVLSTCAWGEDIRSELPAVRPDARLVRLSWDLDRGLDEYTTALGDEEDRTGLWAWVFKLSLRCAQLLVVEREGAYGRDLYPCWQAFSRHYPDWRDRARQALEWCLKEPATPPEEERAAALVSELGAFLGDEYRRLYGERSG